MLEAIDYAEIQNIVNLYPHVIDVPANYGRVADIFAPDGVFDAGPLGRHEGIAAMTEYWAHSPVRAAALEKTNLLAHNVVNVHVFEDETGAVRCWSRCIGVSKDGKATIAVYDDTLRKTDKGWRIALRKLVPMDPPSVTLR